jgi:hypothetical protein
MAAPTQGVEQPVVAPAPRRSRRSRFLRIVVAITIAMHVPVALAVAELARRLGLPAPGLVGLAWAAAGAGLFASRLRAAMNERKRSAALVRGVDLPYFVH